MKGGVNKWVRVGRGSWQVVGSALLLWWSGMLLSSPLVLRRIGCRSWVGVEPIRFFGTHSIYQSIQVRKLTVGAELVQNLLFPSSPAHILISPCVVRAIYRKVNCMLGMSRCKTYYFSIICTHRIHQVVQHKASIQVDKQVRRILTKSCVAEKDDHVKLHPLNRTEWESYILMEAQKRLQAAAAKNTNSFLIFLHHKSQQRK